MNKTAILITCYNRKKTTLFCLESIFKFTNDVDVYVVDDNSTDGTSAIIKKEYPKVNLIQGSGDLYWNRGMCLAWQEASKLDYSNYILLNDDVVLNEDTFKELYDCSSIKNEKAIIVGIIADNKTNEIIYGGRNEKGQLIAPNGDLNKVFSVNGNVVLIPRYVYNKLGTLDPFFIHDYGDVDYGFRAHKQNIEVVTTRCVVGIGETNPICRVRLNNSNIFKRFKKLYSPLGANPFKHFYFLKRHKNIFKSILYFIFLHFLNIIPDFMNRLLFGKKYT